MTRTQPLTDVSALLFSASGPNVASIHKQVPENPQSGSRKSSTKALHHRSASPTGWIHPATVGPCSHDSGRYPSAAGAGRFRHVAGAWNPFEAMLYRL